MNERHTWSFEACGGSLGIDVAKHTRRRTAQINKVGIIETMV